eukprot:4720465-Pyramimonas_sp.AAC.1
MPLAHRKAMCAAMGGLDPEWAVKMNAGDYVASPRERLWIGNFPHPVDTITCTRPPGPWEPRWAYRPDGRTPTWTQSRAAPGDSDATFPSSYQTHLLCLLYNEDSGYRWSLRNPTELKHGAGQILTECGAEQRFPGRTEGSSL